MKILDSIIHNIDIESLPFIFTTMTTTGINYNEKFQILFFFFFFLFFFIYKQKKKSDSPPSPPPPLLSSDKHFGKKKPIFLIFLLHTHFLFFNLCF